MFVRVHLRASSSGQGATRAYARLEAFAAERELSIAAWWAENQSGAKLDRPELFRLPCDAGRGDTLLIDQVGHLARPIPAEWRRLESAMATRRVRLAAVDLPPGWTLADAETDEFTASMLDAGNGMMPDMPAATTRKDHAIQCWRPAQGQARAADGIEKSRARNKNQNTAIEDKLRRDSTSTTIAVTTRYSMSTIKRITDRIHTRQPA